MLGSILERIVASKAGGMSIAKTPNNDPDGSEASRSASGTVDYLLAGQASELERLQLQSRVW